MNPKEKPGLKSDDEMEVTLPLFFQQSGGGNHKEQLEARGIFLLTGEISDQTVEPVMNALLSLHFKNDFEGPVQLIINSPGGSCDAGYALIDIMNFVRYPVATIAIGSIASMGTSIFIAGDARIMSANSLAMIHHFWANVQGTYPELIATRKMEDLAHQRELNLLLRHSKYDTEDEVRSNLLKSEDHWMTPKEMKEHGLCDQISRPRSDFIEQVKKNDKSRDKKKVKRTTKRST